MSVEESSSPTPPAWDGVDLSVLPAEVGQVVSRFMADTDALCTAAAGAGLDGRGAQVIASVLAAAISRLTVAKVQTLPVIDADGLWALGGARSFPVWVADHHHLAVHTARAQVRLARTLRDHLPATAAAAATGAITTDHAEVLAVLAPTTDQRRHVLGDPDHPCNERFLVDQARTLGVDQLRVLVRQWAAYTDPDADDRGYIEATDREHLQISRLRDGYHLHGQLTLEHGQHLKAALTALSPVPATGDTRSADQRRAQALADLARLTLDHGLTGTAHTVRPRINVLIDHPTFTTLINTAGTDGAPAPATQGRAVHRPTPTPPAVTPELLTGQAIAGGPQFEDATPIPRALLNRLACDSELKRLIFGPQSEILDVGRSARTFTRARRDAIIARDKHCRYPGCTAPPALSECHHVRHWARDHGPTAVTNGILLCWYHHDLVHRRHITIHRRTTTWTFTDTHGKEIRTDHIHHLPSG